MSPPRPKLSVDIFRASNLACAPCLFPSSTKPAGKMPKSQKQKKAKAADFTKARLKVGKGKQIASNATNTNYSSKSPSLPPLAV